MRAARNGALQKIGFCKAFSLQTMVLPMRSEARGNAKTGEVGGTQSR
mgnify:FL=1